MKINKRQLRQLIEQFDDDELDDVDALYADEFDADEFDDDEFDIPELARFSVVVFQEESGGELWVNFEDLTHGGSGNNPLDRFESTLRHSAETTLRDLQRM